MGSGGGLLASLPLSLPVNGMYILCSPRSQITGTSSCIVGMTIDLGPPPRGKQTKFLSFCLSDHDSFFFFFGFRNY